MAPPIFRFAPSPNGYLHLGHALSALLNYDMARAAGGRFLLRIEDIDATRCRPEFEAAIYEDLVWLGIQWEEPVRRQSEHLEAYRAAIQRLERQGLIYPSFESRAEIADIIRKHERSGAWPRDPDGVPVYPGTGKFMSLEERERRIAENAPYALRLDMQAAVTCYNILTWDEIAEKQISQTIEARPLEWGDVVLARKEIPTSYHLSVVIDDALQGVTHVVRGQDLFASTSVHRLLQKLLDLPAPIYSHHRLILDEQGKKLSKSTHATGLRKLRAQGITPTNIRHMLGLAEH